MWGIFSNHIHRTLNVAVNVPSACSKSRVGGQKVAKAFNLRSKLTEFATTGAHSNFRKRLEVKGFSENHRELIRGRVSQYDASMGRWLTKDPILFNGRDVNLYGYVLNDPINFIDPSGKVASKSGADSGTWMTTVDPPLAPVIDFTPGTLAAYTVINKYVPVAGTILAGLEAFFGPSPETFPAKVMSISMELGRTVFPGDPIFQGKEGESKSCSYRTK